MIPLTFFQLATANGTSGTVENKSGGYGRTAPFNFQANVTGTGAVTATFNIYGSNFRSNVGGVLLGTITLNGSGTVTDGVELPGKWRYMYAVLSNLTGTGAIASAWGGQ